MNAYEWVGRLVVSAACELLKGFLRAPGPPAGPPPPAPRRRSGRNVPPRRRKSTRR